MSEAKAMAPLEVLARYFTGAEVGHNSIGLQMQPGGMMKLRERAERFFECREALGINGYMNADEAARKIVAVLKSADSAPQREEHTDDFCINFGPEPGRK